MTERIVHAAGTTSEKHPHSLTRQQAQALRAELPSIAWRQVVAVQALAGLAVAVPAPSSAIVGLFRLSRAAASIVVLLRLLARGDVEVRLGSGRGRVGSWSGRA